MKTLMMLLDQARGVRGLAQVICAAVLMLGTVSQASITVITDSAMLQPTDCGDCDAFGQGFGAAVALDGDTAVVGASSNDNAYGWNAGAAWVYQRASSGSWLTDAKLMPADGRAQANFGWSVALQGDTAVIGAMGQTTATTADGAVYVFHRDSAGVWIQTAKLTASDPNFQGYFGVSLALDGDTLVVGARNFGYGTGAAYVFVRDATGTWTQQAKLTGSDVTRDGGPFYASSYFGWSVDIDGDTVVVGDPLGNGGAVQSGAAYVFFRDSGGTWREQGKLIVPLSADADDPHESFGSSVAVDRDLIVVGSVGFGSALTGAAYVFQRDAGGFWQLMQQLTSSNYSYSDNFGSSVAIENDHVVVSAPNNGCVQEIGRCGIYGTVHRYVRDSNGEWVEDAVLMAHINQGPYWAALGGQQWGAPAVAISRGRILAGAMGFSAYTSTPVGAAYVFEEDSLAPSVFDVSVAPNPAAVGATPIITAVLDDAGAGGSPIASAYYTIDGGAPLAMSPSDGQFDQAREGLFASVPGLPVGVYTICIGGTDASGNAAASSCAFLVVYDPSAGFVTGGGWILSPAGAMPSAPALTGRASFGFVSRYQKGATVPTGNTEFQFQVGRLNFSSSSYEWLVVAGGKAMYKGSGTINGTGNFGFILSAIDGDLKGGPDRFRIKIWDRDNGDAVVYDNNAGAADGADPATAISGGSIVIHST